MITINTPVLQTERLILRPFCADDAQAVFTGWETDPDVAKYMFWKSHNDINKTHEWLRFEAGKIAADDWFRWALVLKENNALIGTALIYFEEEYNLFEVGYNLSKAYWGKGYTVEAMREIIHFAKTIGIEELVGRCAEENAASAKVMKKLGFEFKKNIPYLTNEDTVLYKGEEYRLYL